MKLLLKSLALFLGLAFATPALAFSYSCADWKAADFWKEATPAIIADCVAMGFSVNDRNHFGATRLHLAAELNSNPDVISALIKAGADVNLRTAKGATPLSEAASVNPNPDIFTALIKAGADVNARNLWGTTPLHFASRSNSNPEVITILINAGADVNLRTEKNATSLGWLSEKVGGERTPLHFAVQRNSNPDVISALIKAGADVHARDEDGSTPLHLAGWLNSNPDNIADLIKAGADVNARNEWGHTPLHSAAMRNSNPDVISALIKAGADGSIEDNDGKTPFDLAKKNEAIKYTDAYWALSEARFNKGVQPALVAPPESSSVPIFEPHMIGGDIDAFITAVSACWVVEPGAEWARVTVTVGFSLGQDGRVVGDVRMISASGGNDAQTSTAFQAARRAILRCQSSGYKLPPEKYQSWQNMEMTFDASDMRLR